MNATNRHDTRERGAVAIIVALSLPVLIGFAGLALDLGRLFVTKTELHNAADACALAAANELVCDPSITSCPREFLQNAQSAGIFVGSRNKKDFQGSSVTIAPNDIKFYTALAPNKEYKSLSELPINSADEKAYTKSTFAMCTARATGLIPYLMGVLGIGPQDVSAQAVATRAPSQAFCSSAPIGICAASANADFGYKVEDWIKGDFTDSSNPTNKTTSNGGSNGNGGNNVDPVVDDSTIAGGFRWVDFTTSAGGTNEVRDRLTGKTQVCGISVSPTQNVQEQGVKQGVKSAWNTRFGIYSTGSGETEQTAPPDKTGFAYPSKSGPAIAIGKTAYADYVTKQASNSPFDKTKYDGSGNITGRVSSNLSQYGAERRLVAAPVISCETPPKTERILAVGCVLMLNPMSDGPKGTIYLEWRGLANSPGSPCRSAGVPGGVSGPRVPTLVQ